MSCGRLVSVGLGVVGLTVWAASAWAEDRPPKVDTSKPAPVVYPVTAQERGEEGTVVISVYVADNGKPQRFNIAKSSGFGDLDNAAIETAMNWHYLPATRNGSSASDWGDFQIVYKLPAQAESKTQADNSK
ncbi:MAG: energy transducer TonB [Alphaproteobacteria bacterium]|nr:energy transducer TonB [Alphaproteobacteria bacterium]